MSSPEVPRPDAPAPSGDPDDRAALDAAIAALEAQRGVLGDAVVDAALAPLQQRRDGLDGVVEQRRLVTVLFADLAESTELTRRLDPEEVRELVGECFARWRRIVEENGGEVEKFIGDALLAVFGLRRSFEDDAQRAVRAALEMRDGLEGFNDEVGAAHGVRIRARIGIDSGEAVVTLGGAGDFRVVGPIVNRASRLQSTAPIDGVIVSPETRRLIRGRFSMRDPEDVMLKGFDAPVTASIVIRERPATLQLDGPGGVEGVETPTVGRDVERRMLEERFLDVVEERAWRVVTIVGDAGVGKTRLLAEFDAYLAESPQPAFWFRGRAAPSTRNVPNALARSVLTHRLQVSEDDGADTVRAKLEEGFRGAWGSDHGAEHASHLVGAWLGLDLGPEVRIRLDPLALRTQASAALAEFFLRLGRMDPIVVLIEDLHWADEGSLAWIDEAAETLAGTPMLVIATARPAFIEARPRWGEGLGYHERIHLGALSRRESRVLAEQLLRFVPDRTEFVDLVVAAGEGNPFYLEELVTWLVDEGALERAEPAWRVHRHRLDRIVVPTSLRGVLQSRLDALPATEREVLQQASVVGRVFWDEAVDRIRDRRDGDRVSDALADLRRRELVFEREFSAFDRAREFLFKHALLRDVAYDGMLRAHRRAYHARVAEWLEEVSRASSRADEYAAVVALHYDRAGDERAEEWYLRAGARALAVYALDEADRLLDRALHLAEDPELRFRVVLAREDLHERRADRDAQRADLDELDRLAERLDGPEPRIRAHLAAARALNERSDYPASIDRGERAAILADEAGRADLAAEGRLWVGKGLAWMGRTDEAVAALDAAFDGARREGRIGLEAETLRYLSMTWNDAGDFPRALDLVDRAVDLFRSIDDLEGEGASYAQRAASLFNAGRTAEARDYFERALPVFEHSGHRVRRATVLSGLAIVATAEGRLVDARRHGRAAVGILEGLGEREALAVALINLGNVAAAVGDRESAERHFDAAAEQARGLGAALEADVEVRRALLLHDAGRGADAADRIRSALVLADEAPSPASTGMAQLAAGWILLGIDEAARALEAFAAAREAFEGLGVEADVDEARLGGAWALARLDRAREALEWADPALARLDDAVGDDALRPADRLLAAFRVLEAAGDAGASDVLRRGQELIRRAAAAIGDDEMAAGYLATAPNAALLRLRS